MYPALLPLIRTPRLPVVEWNDTPADLNGLVRFAERRYLVSERVPSHFKRSLQLVRLCLPVWRKLTDWTASSFHALPIHTYFSIYPVWRLLTGTVSRGVSVRSSGRWINTLENSNLNSDTEFVDLALLFKATVWCAYCEKASFLLPRRVSCQGLGV